MTSQDRAFRGRGNFSDSPIPVNVLLLASVGLALVAAGVLLSFLAGPLVPLGKSLVTVLDWCF
jgi:hypothetical protein